MDKKKSILNVSVSMTFKILTMVLAIVVRRCLIQTCGNEVNGLNALYLSIIGFLTVAELGVGSAITFCMYRPIVEGKTEKVAALYHLFRRWYLAVGGIILAAGLALTPFIHHFAKDYAQVGVNLYASFVLMLVSVVLTYIFGAKTALINAHKNNYITTAISSGGILLQYGMQIIVLKTTGSFSAYLICRTVAVLVQWSITEWITKRKYSAIVLKSAVLDRDTRLDVTKNIKAMFMHKIGYLLVNMVDSIVISAFIGVAALGFYTNYTVILDSMAGILMLMFTSLTSVFGHMYVENSKETSRTYCDAFHLINYVLGVFFFLGYYGIIDNLIAILFSDALIVEKSVSGVIAVNGFIQFLRRSVLVFRESTGTFYDDRWKALGEGITNMILSIILVQKVGVTGVILATILTNLLICHIVEPFVLYKHAFFESPRKYYVQNYGMILIFLAAISLLDFCMITSENQWMEFFGNGCISVMISVGACAVSFPVCRGMWNSLLFFLKGRQQIKNEVVDYEYV